MNRRTQSTRRASHARRPPEAAAARYLSTKANVYHLALVAMLMLCIGSPAEACSICRCGDATFNALTQDVFSDTGLHLALDWDRYAKSQGAAAESESIVENRYTAMLAYTLSERLLLVGRLPYSARSLTETEGGEVEEVHGSGFSDPEIYGQFRLWSSAFTGDVGRRTSVIGLLGVKTDWGEDNLTRDGERLDEHVQPGTGARDYFVGLSAYYLLDRQSAIFGSLQYRDTGTNSYGYHYGNSRLASLAYERKLSPRFDAVVELDYRHAQRDEVDDSGEIDPDTGGSVVYVSPRLLIDAGAGVVLRAAVQIPIVENLYGFQDEEPVYNLGFTYDLGNRD